MHWLKFLKFLNGVKHTLTLFGSSALISAHSKQTMLQKLFFHLDIFYSSFIRKFLQTFLVDLMIMLDLNEQDFVRDGFG